MIPPESARTLIAVKLLNDKSMLTDFVASVFCGDDGSETANVKKCKKYR